MCDGQWVACVWDGQVSHVWNDAAHPWFKHLPCARLNSAVSVDGVHGWVWTFVQRSTRGASQTQHAFTCSVVQIAGLAGMTRTPLNVGTGTGRGHLVPACRSVAPAEHLVPGVRAVCSVHVQCAVCSAQCAAHMAWCMRVAEKNGNR